MDTDNQARYQQIIQKTLDDFAHALTEQDLFECAKKVGVMEFLGVPDTDYYSALSFHATGDAQNAIARYEKIGKESTFYPNVLEDLAIDYMLTGDYLKLHEVLQKDEYLSTPLAELDLRIQCLEHMAVEDFKRCKDALETVTARDVPAANYSGDDAELFFSVCSMLAIALVITGECINQCTNYQIRTGSPNIDIPNNPDLARFADEYDKWCYILQLSKHLLIFQMPDGITSLADCALSGYNWENKLRIFTETNHIKQILQLILTLCRPEVHLGINRMKALEKVLEAFMHIRPQEVAHLISVYFDDIQAAYMDGDTRLAQYIGYAYSEILATGEDTFDLEEKIKSLQESGDESERQIVATRIKMARKMSLKGHDALMNAEYAFAKTKGDVPGAKDYSALSLQFFRVLEIEYCEKLMYPLANVIDIEKLRSLAEQSDEDWKVNSWNRDCSYIDKIKSGRQRSIEVGAVRTLLAHVIGYKTKEDPSAIYLRSLIDNILSDVGKQALQNKTMLDVIGENVLDRYRTPGAHTGFLPYSTACQAVDYVREKLPVVVGWFT